MEGVTGVSVAHNPRDTVVIRSLYCHCGLNTGRLLLLFLFFQRVLELCEILKLKKTTGTYNHDFHRFKQCV